MLMATPREVPAVIIVKIPMMGYGVVMVAALVGVTPVTGVFDMGPPFLGTRGGPKPAYGPVR